LLDFHKKKNADCTIGSSTYRFTRRGRFGFMDTNKNDRIVHFGKSPKAQELKASMGIYISIPAFCKNTANDEQNVHPPTISEKTSFRSCFRKEKA
jgi:glucose-1-phosphate adenylyltransferase